MSFTPGSPLVWSLGTYENPDVQFNGFDDWGVQWLLEHPAGWDTVTAEVPIEDLPGDGARFGPGRFKARVLQLRGAFRGDPSQLDAAETRLRDAVEHVRRDQTLSVTEVLPKSLSVRLTGELHVDYFTRRMRTFTAVVTAADPLKYAAGVTGLVSVDFALQDPASVGGVTFPVEMPMEFTGGAADASTKLVTNPGRIARFPQLEFVGPVTGPRLVRVGSPPVFHGVSGSLAGSVVAAANLSSRSLLIDGASRISRRYPGSTFWSLPGGRDTTVRFIAEAYDANAKARLSFRPAWR